MKSTTSWLVLLHCILASHSKDLPFNASIAEIRLQVRDWSCALPNTNVSIFTDNITTSKNMRWLMIGADEAVITGAKYRTPGIGNYLVFWPAMFWFAVFTGRSVVVGDGIMSEFCYHMNCGLHGFKTKSDMMLANLYENTTSARNMGNFHLIQHLQGNGAFLNENAVRGDTNSPATEWWSYFSFAGRCVSKLSRCAVGDVGCAERFAYQRLIPGPFQNLPLDVEQRVHGMPGWYINLIKTRSHSSITLPQRISACFHIRREFMHFENGSDPSDPQYLQEVYNWSNGSEAQMVYTEFLNRFLYDLPELVAMKTRNLDPHSNNKTLPGNSNSNSNSNSTLSTIFVYICSDNNHIKRVLADKIYRGTINSSLHNPIQVMYLDAPLTHNSKNRLVVINGTVQRNNLVDLSFDFYLMSLSNHIYSWRGLNRGGSTLVGAAGRLSGTLNVTKVLHPLGHGGILSKRFNFAKNRRGSYRWDQENGYTTNDIFENFTLADMD